MAIWLWIRKGRREAVRQSIQETRREIALDAVVMLSLQLGRLSYMCFLLTLAVS